MATGSAYFPASDRPALTPGLRHAQVVMLGWAILSAVWAIVAIFTLRPSTEGTGVLIGSVLPELAGGVLAVWLARLPRWPALTVAVLEILLAIADLAGGSPRGIVQLVLPVLVLVLLLRGYRQRRTGVPAPDPQAGSAFFQWLALGVLAAIILASLAVAGIGATIGGGVGTVVCRIVDAKNCDTTASGKNGRPGTDGTPATTATPRAKKAGTNGSNDNGKKPADKSKCHGFWGCTWHYTGGQVYGFGKGVVKSVYQMGDGIVTSVMHPTQFVKGIEYAADHPGQALKSIFLGDAEKDWANGDYGEAIGDVVTNTGTLLIPYADIGTAAGDAGKVGKLGELGKLGKLGDAGKLGDVGKLGKLGELAADGDRAAADAAKAAKDGDVGGAQKAADKADSDATKAEDQGRKDGCKVGALGDFRVAPLIDAPLIHLGGRFAAPVRDGCGEDEQNNLNKAEKDKKDADQAVVDANLNVGPKDAQAVRDRLAKSGQTLKKTQNVGVAGYDIDGVGTGRVEGVSGATSPPGTAPIPQNPKFDPVSPDGTAIRPNDSEYKILENIAEKITPASTGKVRLYSERTPCPACSSVIDQFKAKYPNIQVEVVHG